jgi:hypothetical protein
LIMTVIVKHAHWSTDPSHVTGHTVVTTQAAVTMTDHTRVAT